MIRKICMIKKITALVLMIVLSVMAAGCSDGMSQEDIAINEKMMGAWVPVNDIYAVYDADGNLAQFSVYEFTGTRTKYHEVKADSVMSWVVNDYTVKDGKYRVVYEGKTMYQDISFTEDGNLVLSGGGERDEFRPFTDEEQERYHVPLGQLLNSEEGYEESVSAAQESMMAEQETQTAE